MDGWTDGQKIHFHQSFTFNNQVGVVGDPRPTIWADDAAVAAGAALWCVANTDSGGEAAVIHHSSHHQCRVFTVPLLQGFRTWQKNTKETCFLCQKSHSNQKFGPRLDLFHTPPDPISSFRCRIICQFGKTCRALHALLEMSLLYAAALFALCVVNPVCNEYTHICQWVWILIRVSMEAWTHKACTPRDGVTGAEKDKDV